VGPGLKYTLARLGLLVAAFLILLPVPINFVLKLFIAIVVSAILSFFLLRGLRDQYALSLQNTFERRKAEKAKLRSALAGDKDAEEPDTDRDSDGPNSKSETQH
jgi:hypothetical protein